MLGVDNLVVFTLRILDESVQSTSPFLLSDQEASSTESLVRAIGSALGREPRILNFPIGVLHAIGRAGDLAANWGFRLVTSADIYRLTRSLRIDSSRAWTAAGITPSVPLDEGIRRVAHWYIRRQ